MTKAEILKEGLTRKTIYWSRVYQDFQDMKAAKSAGKATQADVDYLMRKERFEAFELHALTLSYVREVAL